MTEYNKMKKGLLHTTNDLEIRALKRKTRSFLDEFNNTKYNDFEQRELLVRNQFLKVGENIRINKPLHVDYGNHIIIGDNFYSNFDLLILDVCKVTIGNNVMFGPRVSIFTATHPIDPICRNEGLESCVEVVIGNNVWIGGNTVINPGVTIGDNTVIGSGSVVTRSIPSNVIAFGNPAKVYREINAKDLEDYNNQLLLINK